MFETRALEAECLDDPTLDSQTAMRSYHFMRTVNRYLGGVRGVRRFLERFTVPGQTVRVLDLGSGASDIPLAVTRGLGKTGRRIEFTCLEKNPAALNMARANIAQAGNPSVTLVEADVFEFKPAVPFDFAVGSMFFHHLSDDDIIKLITRLRSFVTSAVFINDLRRSAFHYFACRLALLAADPVTKHDALLSIRRGFRRDQLSWLLASVPESCVVIEHHWFCRITAQIWLSNPPSNRKPPA